MSNMQQVNNYFTIKLQPDIKIQLQLEYNYLNQIRLIYLFSFKTYYCIIKCICHRVHDR